MLPLNLTALEIFVQQMFDKYANFDSLLIFEERRKLEREEKEATS